ncbi:MAG: hypothetical protein HY703_05945, partial [Gemmatimonadetes bacterium]|nr:hypothetical protein [Gemmatimonadota bacterium]
VVLGGASAATLAGEVGARARLRRRNALLVLAGLSAVALALGLAGPDRSRAGWAPLLNPVEYLSPAPLPPLAVEPGDAEVPRGGSLDVRVEAPGRLQVTLHWRSAGDVPRQRTLRLESARVATQLAGIDAPLGYWVTAPDGAASATFHVTPLDPLLVSDLVVDVTYPAYLEQPPERFEGEVPPLEVPAGTVLEIRGRATRRLREAALVRKDGGSRVRLVTLADRFTGRWMPAAGGVYDWRLIDQAGGGAAATPPPIELSMLEDRAPQVEITFPGADTLLGPELTQPVVADARDDHGLAAATLVSWRVSALGDRDPAVEEGIPLEGEAERVVLRAVLDASARRLLPGDTLRYFVRVVDSSPARQVGVSRSYALRLPSMEELRRRAAEAAESLVEDAESLARLARQQEQAARDAQRRASGSSSRSESARASAGARGRARPGQQGESSADLAFREAEQARQVLERQEAMVRRVEELRARTEALDRAIEAAGLRDPALQQRLEELRQLYEQMLTPELLEKLAELRASLQELDPERVREAVEQLARQQQEFRRRIEQSLELLRRAAAEQQMSSLARQAEELATQEQALAEALKTEEPPTAARAEQQRQLMERADSLSQALNQLQQRLAEQGESQAAAQTVRAAEQVQSAQQRMAQSAQSAAQAAEQAQQAQQSESRAQQQSARQQAGQAAEQAQQAAAQLAEAARSLNATRQAMAESWRQEVQETVQRATNDALALAQRQNALLQQMQQAQQQRGGASPSEMQGMRAEQAALQQGLEALGRNLAEAGQRSAMVNRDVGAALGRALLSSQQTVEALEGKNGPRRVPVQEAMQTLDALNRLALALLANSEQIAQSESGTGLQQMLEQLAELAKRQGAVNGQANSLLPLDLAPQVLTEQLQRLARAQQQVAKELGGLQHTRGGREHVLGELEAMAQEAEQLARELAGGRLTPELLARQERLFHRLLDAGHTLERDEVSDERVAERPSAVPPSRAQPLDPELLQGGPRFPLPDPEQLRALPPAYRRLILEYFDRLNRGPAQEARK